MGASITTGQLLWNVTTNDIFFPSALVADHGKVTTRVLRRMVGLLEPTTQDNYFGKPLNQVKQAAKNTHGETSEPTP